MEWKVGDVFTHSNIGHHVYIKIYEIDYNIRTVAGFKRLGGKFKVYKVTGQSSYTVGQYVTTRDPSLWHKVNIQKSNKPAWF